QHKLTFPIALGNEAIKHHFSISSYPSYYVINEENTIIGKSIGYSSELGLYFRSL
ncbi:MAG TPA: TlpA family protein disulfide reductase, partial [Colwellia sp.]|nr:TlpA family protein disulfide reductase [Colwellia sp.]